jgi:hypothetical protein
MLKFIIIGAVALVLITGLGTAGAMSMANKSNDVSRLKSEKASLVNIHNADVTAAQAQQHKLNVTQFKLSQLKKTAASNWIKLKDANAQVKAAKADALSARSDASSSYSTGYDAGKTDGYNSGYSDAGNNYCASGWYDDGDRSYFYCGGGDY